MMCCWITENKKSGDGSGRRGPGATTGNRLPRGVFRRPSVSRDALPAVFPTFDGDREGEGAPFHPWAPFPQE